MIVAASPAFTESAMDEIWRRLLQDRGYITLPLGLALSLLVTLHVLLRKREVATSVGWIGLAWFAPVTGAIMYFLMGINRVQRRARRLRRDGRSSPSTAHDTDHQNDDGHLDALQQGIRSITGRPLLGCNIVEVFQDGEEAYKPMLVAIETATRSIGLSSYIFRNDVWGNRFIDALNAAQARGVAVRVLIDGIGGGWLRSPAYHHLRRHSVPAARFLHSLLPWRMPFLNLRSHKKILVIDGIIGFTGGINIGDENVMSTSPRAPVQDTHFCIRGPVISQLSEVFAQDWLFATEEMLDGEVWFPELADAGGKVSSRVIDSGPDEDVEKIEFAMLQAVACARDSVAIMTPYFLPDDRLVTALSLATMRGVSVDVVIPEKGNHKIVDWATRANIGPLLSDGVRVWLCPPPFRHSKIMIVDHNWVLIGSCNWDIRSFRLNFELCVESYDTHLAASLSNFIMRCRGSQLTELDLMTRSLPTRLRDAAARLALPYL